MTSLEQDLEMLEDPSVTGNRRMAVVYRSERKKIMANQIELVLWLINLVKESVKLEEMKKRGDDMQSMHAFY